MFQHQQSPTSWKGARPMRNKLAILAILYVGCAMAYTPWWKKMASYLQDASFAYSNSGSVTNFSLFNVEIPDGTHSAITLTGWYAHPTTNNYWVTPQLFYTPEPVQYSNPDLLGGAWAHGVAGGTNLVTAFSFNGFPFSSYTNHPDVTNLWRWGVYTVDGWSSNAVTLNLGGTDFSFGPGTFKRNCIAGGSGDCILTGSGLVSIGISKTPCHKFYDAKQTINSFNSSSWLNGIWASNGISFISMRITATGTNHIYNVKVRRKGYGWDNSYTATNVCPYQFNSRGIYQLSFVGIYNGPNKPETTFDYRIFSFYLTDDELERVYQNGVDEATRRGL
jgi:hypothetical protein